MVKIALLAFNYPVQDISENSIPTFKDIKKNDWYTKYLAASQKAGIISGYGDGTFRPNNPVSLAEAVKILLIASEKSKTILYNAPATPFKDVIATAWYAKFINFAYEKKFIEGKTPTLLGPNDNISRGKIATLTVKIMEL